MIGINRAPSEERLVDDAEQEVLSSKLDAEQKKLDQVEVQIKQLTEQARVIRTRMEAFHEALEDVRKRARKRAAQQKPDQLQAPDRATTPPPAPPPRQQDKSIWDDKQALVLEVIDWVKQDITVKQKALLVVARHPDSTAKEVSQLLSESYGQKHPQNSVEGRISSLHHDDGLIENSRGKYCLTDKGRKEVEKFVQEHG
jgi:chromosome segregation ATPase